MGTTGANLAGTATAGEKLALRRMEMGLTQEDLAARTDLSVRTISDLERGRTLRPRSRSLRRLAAALGLDRTEVARLFTTQPVERARPAWGGGAEVDELAIDWVLPRQLPMAPRCFAGRRYELRALSTLLDEVSRVMALAVVSGPAGVGKTALAVTWAHQMADRFPDGQLYVNLHGHRAGGPPRTGDVINGFLEALHVPAARVPAGVEARAALYRSLLAGRRVLLVLDGARDEEEVLPLLPGGAGCLVVVTSRSPLLRLVASHGAHPVRLEPFSEGDAREYLTNVLGPERVAAEPAAVSELIARHGHVPLQLSLAAAHAALVPSLSLADLPC